MRHASSPRRSRVWIVPTRTRRGSTTTGSPLHHEDMHGEAWAYMRQTWATPRRRGRGPRARRVARSAATSSSRAAPHGRDGTRRALPLRQRDGSTRGSGAAVPPRAGAGHAGRVPRLRRGRRLRAGELWSAAGRAWLAESGARAPVYWRRDGDAWLHRRFDAWVALEPHCPVVHVNAHEADAYCALGRPAAADRARVGARLRRGAPPVGGRRRVAGPGAPGPDAPGLRLRPPTAPRATARTATASWSGTSGSGPRAPSSPTRASSPAPTRSTRPPGSGPTACCAAAPSRPAPDSCAAASATSSARSAATSFAGFRTAEDAG